MYKKFKHKCALIFACYLVFVVTGVEGAEYEVSGFSRVVAGIIDTKDVTYFGYDDNLSFDNNSSLGLQGKIDFNQQWSVTALGLLRANKDQRSGVEWLYVTWRPVESLRFKAGKMQTPFFSLSDVLDVSFAYPWAIAPREVYNDFIFKSFNGADVRYSMDMGDATFHIEGYLGYFKDDVIINGGSYGVEVDELSGLIAELDWKQWRFRASHHTAKVDVNNLQLEQFAQVIRAAGFERSAHNVSTNGTVDFLQLSAEYDSLNYFFKAEYTNVSTGKRYYADISAFYISAGYHFDQFSTYLTFSQRRDDLFVTTEQIPMGVSPQLDMLNVTFHQIMQNRTDDDIDTWTYGGRWNFNEDMALKVELKDIHSKTANSTTLLTSNVDEFDGRAKLLVVSWEWLF